MFLPSWHTLLNQNLRYTAPHRMEKDFEGWNERKKQINGKKAAPFCHERELWWCALGVNMGNEQDGAGTDFRRPVLVLRGLSARTSLVIPLTTAPSDHPFRPSIGLVDGKEARALLSQMRVIDTKRLARKIGYLDQDVFDRIKTAAKRML